MSVLLFLLVPLLFGFACGYGVREWISRRRRRRYRQRDKSSSRRVHHDGGAVVREIVAASDSARATGRPAPVKRAPGVGIDAGQ
jgi:hypothetical protein